MKRFTALLLAVIMLAAVFAGCETEPTQRRDPVVVEKIELENVVYNAEIPADSDPPALPIGEVEPELLAVMRDAVEVVTSDNPDVTMMFDLSAYYTEMEWADYTAIEHSLVGEFGKDARTTWRSTIQRNGAWVVGSRGDSFTMFSENIVTLKLTSFENIDEEIEYIVDVQRNGNTLKTLRYVMSGDTTELVGDTKALYYNGEQGGTWVLGRNADASDSEPTLSGYEKNMYFSGKLFKTGIKEMPVTGGIDFNVQFDATIVEGEVKGGFAGMLQGTVTVDGNAITLTGDTFGMTIPMGLVDNPANYYLAISRVAVANPQDNTAYRNIYLINKDFTEVFGYYLLTTTTDKVNSWFVMSRTDEKTFKQRTDDNHKKLMNLYISLFIEAHGGREKLSQMVIPSNMLIGTYFDEMSAATKKELKSVAEKVYEYYYAMTDETVAKEGLEGGVFFPLARSAAIRLFEFDGMTAIAAVDYSSKENDGGFGGLYRATYENGAWTFEVLSSNRIS